MQFHSYEEILDYVKDHAEVWHSPEFPSSNPHFVLSRTMILYYGFKTKLFFEPESLIVDIKDFMETNNIPEATLSTNVIANVECSFTGTLLNNISRLTKKQCYFKNGNFKTKIVSVKNVDNKNKTVVFFDAPIIENDERTSKYQASWGKSQNGKLSSCNPRIEEPSQFGVMINTTDKIVGCQYLVDVTPYGHANTKTVMHNINGPAALVFVKQTSNDTKSSETYCVNGEKMTKVQWKKNKTVLTSKLKLIKHLL
jgi:hypothetical protein